MGKFCMLLHCFLITFTILLSQHCFLIAFTKCDWISALLKSHLGSGVKKKFYINKKLGFILCIVLQIIPANISCFQDILKKLWRRLQYSNFLSSKTSSRLLQVVFKTGLQDLFFKMFPRLLQDVFKKTPCKHILKTF